MVIYYQTNIPSPNQSHSFSLSNFVGGLNNRSQEPGINQNVDVMNMKFTEDGFLEKRKGIKYYNDTVFNGEVVYMDIYRPFKDEPKKIVATKDMLYVDGVSVHTLSGQMMGVNHTGRYYYADGDKLYVHSKFEVTNGTYVGVVGTVPTNYVTLIVTNPPADYVPLPVEHVVGKTVYNFDVGTVHYEPCQNELLDTSKGPNIIPENPAYVINREGRLYVAGCTESDDTVFISDVNDPLYFPNNLSLQLPPNSDKIRGLCLYNNTVLVGRSRDMFVIRGETNNLALQSSLFTLQQLTAHTGLANQRTFISAHNYTFYLGTDGQFYIVRTLDTNSDALATSVISKDIDLKLHPLNLKEEDLENASASFFGDSYYVAVGDKVLVYNYLHQAWTVYNQINASCFLRDDKTMVMGTKDGRLVTESDDYLNLGRPYRAYWTSRYLDMGDASSFKFFREFFVVARTFDTWRSDIRFTFEIDYAEFDVGIKIKNQISVWGISKFGDTFINKNINATRPLQIGQRGRVLQIHYENCYDVAGTVNTASELPDHVPGDSGTVCYYVTSEDTYYVYVGTEWIKQTMEDINQPMRVQQISGFYEMRGRRY